VDVRGGLHPEPFIKVALFVTDGDLYPALLAKAGGKALRKDH
jgi:hypothetical protein